jgi:misacylated tRNA(Ala) deacylase
VGNQLYADRARVDLHPISLTDDDLRTIEQKSNKIITGNVDVRIIEVQRTDLEQRVNEERCNLDLIPKSVTNLRVVEVVGFDLCPCAGTHVKNTGELGQVKIQKKENKGKDRERIVYTLE